MDDFPALTRGANIRPLLSHHYRGRVRVDMRGVFLRAGISLYRNRLPVAGAADDRKLSAPELRFSGNLVGTYDASQTLKLI
jgi:hypothetical protein